MLKTAGQYRLKPMLDVDVIAKLAKTLVENNRQFLRDLVAVRKANATQEEIAERMLVSQPTVAAFERYDANPTLATIERYAHAAGASVEFRVKNVFEPAYGWQPGASSTFNFTVPSEDTNAGSKRSELQIAS